MPGRIRPMLFRVGEGLCYCAGALLTVFFVTQLAQGEVQRRQDIAEFENAMERASTGLVASADPVHVPVDTNPSSISTSVSENLPLSSEEAGAPDTSLWAPGRIADYEASMAADVPKVLGLLEVPSVGLKVPVYPSDSELNMDRGAGIIDGMAYPHEQGNIGIAGHRDGYFRVLKDVQVGDSILLQTLEGPKKFTVDSRRVVEISDRSVLQDTEDQTVTLITCYPFYFVGHAPQRFIVTASLDITDVIQQ